MNFFQKNIGIFLLLLLLFSAGDQAFAFSKSEVRSKAGDKAHFQSISGKAIAFDEASQQELIQGQPENPSDDVSTPFYHFNQTLFTDHSFSAKRSTQHLADVRYFLEHQIFPFHFFW